MALSNEELNLSVLQRYYPDVLAIVSITSYSVLYVFSPVTQQWEKPDIEGTLFVVLQTPDALGADRFSVIILNRRGLNNFCTPLLSPDNIEITDEYLMIKVESGAEEASPTIYGLWIHADPAPNSTSKEREVTAEIVMECANRALASRKQGAEMNMQRLQQEESYGLVHSAEMEELVNEAEGVPMARQLSLRELFEQQRDQDSGFSVHNHHSDPPHPAPAAPAPAPAPPAAIPFTTNPDTEFFRTGPRTETPKDDRGPQSQPTRSVDSRGSIAVDDLFRQVRQAQQGS